jgi:hypothetical protein
MLTSEAHQHPAYCETGALGAAMVNYVIIRFLRIENVELASLVADNHDEPHVFGGY